MNLNLKMTVELSKRRSYFLSLVFITKCFTKNLLIITVVIIMIILRIAYETPLQLLHETELTKLNTSEFSGNLN